MLWLVDRCTCLSFIAKSNHEELSPLRGLFIGK